MDKNRLNWKTQLIFKELKEKLAVHYTNKKTLEFIIEDYSRMKKENERMKSDIRLLKLKNRLST